MQHIKQHNNHACIIASIAMLTEGVSYRSIKNYCRKHFQYNVTKQSGCFIEHDIFIEYLESLGHSIFHIKTGASGKISELCKNRKAIIFLSIDDGGHAVAWDGCRIFDPDCKQPYNESNLFKLYDMSNAEVGIIAIDIPILNRVVNRFKSYYYKMLENYEKFISIR